jgi:broad specificity phosphatase PhoE
MKTIEIRRHSHRNAPLPHLSQKGVTLARLVGENLGPFDRVVTSTVPRAFETAIAMGFAVDEQVDLLSTYGAGIESVIPWPQPFSVYQARRGDPGVLPYLHALTAFYKSLAGSLSDGRAALVVSHGGVVELSTIACIPEADYGMEGPVGLCEGVRLAWDNGKCISVEFIRIS